MPDDEIKRATRAMALRKAKAQADKAEAEAKRAQARLNASTRSARAGVSDDDKGYLGTKRKPLKRSRAMGERICRRLEQGLSLRKACAGEMDAAAVLRWVRDSAEFAQQYARAREIGWLSKTDRVLDLIDEAHEAALDPDFGGQRISACRFEVDTLKWVLARMLPKVYGDRASVHVVHAPDAGDGVSAGPSMPADEETRLVEAIAARQAALQLKLEAEMAEAAADGDAQRDAIG